MWAIASNLARAHTQKQTNGLTAVQHPYERANSSSFSWPGASRSPGESGVDGVAAECLGDDDAEAKLQLWDWFVSSTRGVVGHSSAAASNPAGGRMAASGATTVAEEMACWADMASVRWCALGCFGVL